MGIIYDCEISEAMADRVRRDHPTQAAFISYSGGIPWFSKEISERIALAVIEKDPGSLRYLSGQTKKVCEAAVSRDPAMLRYAEIQTAEMCREAVSARPESLRWAKHQDADMCREALSARPKTLRFAKYQDTDACREALMHDPSVIRWVRDQTQDLCETAVAHDWRALEGVKPENRSVELCALALMQDEGALNFIPDDRKEMARETIDNHNFCPGWLPYDGMDKFLESRGQMAQFFEGPDLVKEDFPVYLPEYLMCRVEEDGAAIRFIPPGYQTEAMKKMAKENGATEKDMNQIVIQSGPGM